MLIGGHCCSRLGVWCVVSLRGVWSARDWRRSDWTRLDQIRPDGNNSKKIMKKMFVRSLRLVGLQ